MELVLSGGSISQASRQGWINIRSPETEYSDYEGVLCNMPHGHEEPFEGKHDRFLIIDYNNSRTHSPAPSPLRLAGKSIMTLVNSPLALLKLSCPP